MIEDLLIDFDEMGFMPTTTCEDPNEYALEWKQKLIAEIELIKDEARKETAKEILKSFENRFSLYYPHGILTYDDIENQIISLSEKYGVEVEE